MKPFFSEASLEDFDNIFLEGILRFGLHQAERYKTQLETLCHQQAQTPSLHAPRQEFNELRDDIRVYTHKAHSIVYHPVDGGIRILRIVHASSDWQRDLGKHMW